MPQQRIAISYLIGVVAVCFLLEANGWSLSDKQGLEEYVQHKSYSSNPCLSDKDQHKCDRSRLNNGAEDPDEVQRSFLRVVEDVGGATIGQGAQKILLENKATEQQLAGNSCSRSRRVTFVL